MSVRSADSRGLRGLVTRRSVATTVAHVAISAGDGSGAMRGAAAGCGAGRLARPGSACDAPAMKTALLLLALAGCGGSRPPTSSAAPAPAASGPAAAPAADPAPEQPAQRTVPASSGAGSAAPASPAAVRARLQQLADDMCACKDTACARRVSADLARWGSEVERANGGQIMTQAETEQIMPITERLATCMSNAMARDSGAAP